MFTNNARILIAAIFLSIAAFAAYQKVYEITALSLLGAGYMIWGYFKEGTIVLAAKSYKNKDYEKTQRLLNSIKNPSFLLKDKRAYYELLNAQVAMQTTDYAVAEKHFEQAARLGLKSVSDLGVTLMHLANISLRNKNKGKALAWVNEARKLKLPQNLQSIIGNIEKEALKL